MIECSDSWLSEIMNAFIKLISQAGDNLCHNKHDMKQIYWNITKISDVSNDMKLLNKVDHLVSTFEANVFCNKIKSLEDDIDYFYEVKLCNRIKSSDDCLKEYNRLVLKNDVAIAKYLYLEKVL